MAVDEALLSLASAAGRTVAAAAAGDGWEAVKRGLARLFGRGDPARTEAAERRLEQARGELASVPAGEAELARERVASAWQARVLDLLEEHPELTGGVQAMVGQARAQPSRIVVSAAGHGVAAARDVSITASGGGLAAGTVHGNVMPPGQSATGPGSGIWGTGPGSVNADRGGVAVGRVEYQQSAVRVRPVRLAPRPEFLAGREELLAGLHARLSGALGAGPQVAVLGGLGGCGKTSLAVEYAHRHQDEYGVVWQFPAEEPAALSAGFGELAALLGARNALEGGDPVAQVHAVLAARPGDWLLIFDNAPSAAAVRDALPPAGGGRVLITSQDARWPGSRVLEVPVLDRAAAAGFLRARTGSADAAAAGELAEVLGGLPLALEQAAAYMNAAGRDIASYLDLFRQRRPELLARGEPAGYGKQVATTWTLAFDQVGRGAPLAAGLLRLLACCAPEQVPLRLLLTPRPELAATLPEELARLLDDPLAADDALAALRRFSLASPPHDGLVSVHRLVQATTLDQLDDNQASTWRQAAATVIRAALPDDPRQPGTWPAYAALLPHAEIALPPENPGTDQITNFLGYSGSYTIARDFSRQLAAARQQVLGAGHPSTLTARASLATWTGEAGDAAGARDQYAALLPSMERVFGPGHPDTLEARANLATWTGEAGNAARARDQYAALLPVYERVFGPEHPTTLIVRGNLGFCTGTAGTRRGLATSTRPSCRSTSGSSVPSTPAP